MLFTLMMSVLMPFAVNVAVDSNRDPLPTPLMRTVEPYLAKAGAEIVVSGDNLNKELVAEVYMTANQVNTKVEVLSQSAKEIRFKVPADIKPGAYKLTVLLTSADPTFIEEPVRLVIE